MDVPRNVLHKFLAVITSFYLIIVINHYMLVGYLVHNVYFSHYCNIIPTLQASMSYLPAFFLTKWLYPLVTVFAQATIMNYSSGS